MTEDDFINNLSQFLEPPPPDLRDNVVNRPDKLFRYLGGYRIGKKQKPRRVNPPAVKTTHRFQSAHP